jgi:hypothetical protein
VPLRQLTPTGTSFPDDGGYQPGLPLCLPAVFLGQGMRELRHGQPHPARTLFTRMLVAAGDGNAGVLRDLQIA